MIYMLIDIKELNILMKLFQKNIFSVIILYSVSFLFPSLGWASAYSTAVLADNPVAYWQLAETSGTNADDSTANNKDGTYTGTPSLNQPGAPRVGLDNKAVSFNGTSQYIAFPDVSTSPFRQSSAITYEFWMKLVDSGGYYFMGVGVSQGHGFGGIILSPTAVVFSWTPTGISDTHYTITGQNFQVDQWNHIAVAMNFAGKQAAIYVNGQSVSGTLSQAVTNWTPTPLYSDLTSATDRIGGRFVNTNLFFKGDIDEVAIYNTALSEAQVQAHYNSVSATSKSFEGGTSVVGGGQVTFPAVTAAGEITATLTNPSSAAMSNLSDQQWNFVTNNSSQNIYYDFVSTATHPDGTDSSRTLTFKINPATIPFGLGTADLRGVHVHADNTFHILNGTFNGGDNTFTFTHDGGFSGFGAL